MSALAGYHEAGHVVLAVVSNYYSLKCGRREYVALSAYGAGDVAIHLNPQKCKRHGKEPLETDVDIAKEAAVIMVGGYAAEQVLFKVKGEDPQFTPSETCSRPDWSLATDALKKAGIYEVDREEYTAIAAQQLTHYWANVTSLAERLLAEPEQRLESYDAEQMIEEELGLWPA